MTHSIIVPVCGGSSNLILGANHVDNKDNLQSPCEIYQEALELTTSDVLIYAHDDLEITGNNWLERIISQMECGAVAVGLGGATSLGRPDLYRKQYNIWNLARGGYASNQKDAEAHGKRFTDTRRVAVLDQFCLAVRTSFLHSIGGWPTHHLGHHGLDMWLACEAARYGKETYMVGAECWHHGGGTSVGSKYAAAPWLKGRTPEQEHKDAHQWIFETYRDVLPIVV